MARCPANLLIHERNRWRTMSDRRLFQRLQQITKPDKLACFLWVAADENRGTLFRDGIDRCNALGYTPVERGGGWWDVIPIDRSIRLREATPTDPLGRVTRELSDGTEFLGDPPETVGESITAVMEEFNQAMEDVGTATKKEVEEPKKKKSIYSRKLRTKRRNK